MRVQSDLYNPFTPLRRVGAEINFGLIDINAKKNASSTSSENSTVSKSEQTINGTYTRTQKNPALEHNAWVLDGTADTFLEEQGGGEVGYWSNIGNDGAELNNCFVEYRFSAPVSTVGWTLTFDKNLDWFPVKVGVTAKDDLGTILLETTHDGSGVVQALEYPVQNYSYVRFDFLENSVPLSSVRLVEVDFGINQSFDQHSLQSAKIVYGVDLAADSFPSRQIVFSFDNSDKKYNLLNPTGLYAFLQDGQEITAKIFVNGEAVDMGSFVFRSATAKNSAVTAEILAADIVYSLDTDPAPVGSSTRKTLRDAVAYVLGESANKVNFGGNVGENLVVISYPEQTSKREAIRLLAQAAMCSVWVDRDGVMQFNDLSVGESIRNITADELYDFDGVSVSETIGKVVLTSNDKYSGLELEFSAGIGSPVIAVDNPCVYQENGNAVAAWLLQKYNTQKVFAVKNRGDPAVEVADTIKIEDAYGQNENAIVTGVELTYNGGFNILTTAKR